MKKALSVTFSVLSTVLSGIWRGIKAFVRWYGRSWKHSGKWGKVGLVVLAFFILTLFLVAFGAMLPTEATPTPAVANVSTPNAPTEVPTANNAASTTMSTPTNTPMPTDTPKPTNTPIPTVTPTPTNTPKPTETPTAEEKVCGLITEKLGSINRKGVARVEECKIVPGSKPEVFVRWAINDNLTGGLIRTGMYMDIVDILKAVRNANIQYSTVQVRGTFPLVDVYGNVSEATVVRATYTKTTIDKINWNNFITKNILLIAEREWVHPAMFK